MNPLRYLRTYLHGLWLDALDRWLSQPQLGSGETLPPRIPPEAISMVQRPEAPALTRASAEPPLRGSLADRMQKARPH